MVKRSRYEQYPFNETRPQAPLTGNGGGVNFGSRKKGQCGGDLPSGRNHADAVLPLAHQVQGSGNTGAKGNQKRPQKRDRPTAGGIGARVREAEDSLLGRVDRASVGEKKRELGLHGELRGRHLSKPARDELLKAIELALGRGETLTAICDALEINRRAYYRWKSGVTHKAIHGGGGGHNRITPLEEKKVIAFAEKHPQYRCRRIAYELERRATAFIGKTKVAEILKKSGLNHEFVRGQKHEVIVAGELLLHEPWRKNLLWGMDWTYLRIAGKFWFLLVLLDWYSRKILSYGLFPIITKYQVVAVVTEAVALEGIEELPASNMRPILVADHGSANIAKYTRENIEIQGLELWLSGVGRPTGNARTERVIWTLKSEEINLQPEYESEQEALTRISATIQDYNTKRPNAGNGGFSPNAVHQIGRYKLTERRKEARQKAELKRRRHWNQKQAQDTLS
jgi:putative transposase